ncbi:MAG: hypothetical protein M1575_03520 [Patescibacteria group bacterium]|nr:hypothetical protein [Patescibacteria group bacterium]MCL5095768.1 hypothetical protein [Patescibacteria group bacterium]
MEEITTKPISETKTNLPANDGEVKPTSVPDETPILPQKSPNSPKTLWYILGGIVVVLLISIAGIFAALQKPKKTTLPTAQPTIQQPIPSPKPTLPRSKAPGIVTNVLTASSLDAQGKAVTPITTFAKTEKNIYLALTVNKPAVGTKIEYIRYLNGKYLDNGTNKILKPNITYTSFVWSLTKTGAAHPIGTYKVKAYTNGVFEKETSYTVQ